MAVPVLGKCAVIALVAALFYGGYAFKIREAGPSADRGGTCGISTGKCPAEKAAAAATSSVATHLSYRKFESVRGRFAKIQRPPVDDGGEGEREKRPRTEPLSTKPRNVAENVKFEVTNESEEDSVVVEDEDSAEAETGGASEEKDKDSSEIVKEEEDEVSREIKSEENSDEDECGEEEHSKTSVDEEEKPSPEIMLKSVPKAVAKLENVRHADKDRVKLEEEVFVPKTSDAEEEVDELPNASSSDTAERVEVTTEEPKTIAKSKPRNVTTPGTPKVAVEVTESATKPAKIMETKTKPNVHKPQQAPTNAMTLTELNDAILRVPTFMLNFSAVEDPKCQQHGKIFLRQLRGYKLWALQMLDSGAKIPSGLLRGNVNALGDFDQCLGILTRVKIKEQIVKIQGKYCLATLDLHAIQPDMKVPVNLMQGRSFIRGNMRDPGHFIPRFTTANWALCLPAACSALDAKKALENALEPYNATVGIRFSVNVDPEMCYVKQKSEGYSKETIGVLYFYAMIVCLVAVATIRDFFIKSDEKGNYAERIIMSFSLQRTTRALLKDNSSFTGDVTCIHGIRSLSTIALYVAHKLIPTSRMPYANRVSLTEVANNPISSVLRVSLVYTDSFLLLSGVLTAYNMAKELTIRGEIRWFCRFVTRYIRLTPSLLVIIFWYTFVMEHAGSGPQWNSVIKANADVCKKNAWTNLLYIQNFFPFEEMCATHTHQLALDMQLSLFVPALVFFLQIKPVIGVLLIFFLLQVSATLRYLATANNNLSLVIFHGMTLKHLYKTANLTYMLTLHRATPYLFGVVLGVFLNYTGKNVKISKIFIVLGWAIAAALGLWSLFFPWRAARRDFVYNVEDAAFYAVIGPVSSALALTWVIFACFTNHGGFINRILSNYWLIIFSRISYAVYLMQFAVFFYNVGTTRYTSEFKIHRALDPLELLAVIAVSVIVTLLFDIPMQEVKNVLLECSDGLTAKPEDKKIEEEKRSEKSKKRDKKDQDNSDPDNDGLRKPKISEYSNSSDYDDELDYEKEISKRMKLRRLDVRRQTLIRSETYDVDAEFQNDQEDDDDLYARDRFLRFRRDRSSSRTRSSKEDAKFSRSNFRERPSSLESEEGMSWEFVQRDRSVSRSRDGGKTSIMQDTDCAAKSPKGRDVQKFIDQRRTLSSGSEEEVIKEKSGKARVSDEEDWEEDLRTGQGSFYERQEDAGSIGDEEMDSLRRRSSAEGKLALLQDSIGSSSINLWTVTKVSHLGSSQEPSEPEDEGVYQRMKEYHEKSPVPEEAEPKPESQASSVEEEDVTSFDFVLRKDSKRMTVPDLSKINSEDETEAPRTSSGLFKRESIIKSQASEEDPEYLLPERPKLQEQEQEHPLKKAWQLQKSRSEEDGASGFIIKEVKSGVKNEDEAVERTRELGELSTEVNIIWQMKSIDIQEMQDVQENREFEWPSKDDRSNAALENQTAEELNEKWNVDDET